MALFAVVSGWRAPGKGLFASVLIGICLASCTNIPMYLIGRWLENPSTRPVALVILIVATPLGYSWFRWHRKQVGVANELEWLDELVDEHKRGIRDHSAKLEWLIGTIESERQPSAALTKRLNDVRRILKGETRTSSEGSPPIERIKFKRPTDHLERRNSVMEIIEPSAPHAPLWKIEGEPTKRAAKPQEAGDAHLSGLAELCNEFNERLLQRIVERDAAPFWRAVGLKTNHPPKRTLVAYALTLMAAGAFLRDLKAEKPNEFNLSSELRAKVSDVTLAEAIIFFGYSMVFHAFNELQDEQRSSTVPTKADGEAMKEALPLICSTIEGHTGWTVNEIMAFRIRGYAKAKARSDLIGQFTSIICCSMDKKAITDDDRVSRDLEVASALSLRVQVHVTAYLKTYYDAYKSIILAYPTIR
jgi:hypothetical protein